MANQGLLTSLQPQGTEDYDLEKQQEEWSILEVGGCVAEVLTEKSIKIFYAFLVCCILCIFCKFSDISLYVLNTCNSILSHLQLLSHIPTVAP